MRLSRFLLTAVTSALLAVVVPAQAIDVFLNQFIAAADKDSYNEMVELISKNRRDVRDAFVRYEVQLCSAIANKSPDDIKKRTFVLDRMQQIMAAQFKELWYKSRLDWVKSLTPEQCVKKTRLQELLYRAWPAWDAARNARQTDQWEGAIKQFIEFVALAKEIPDPYWEVEGAWWLGDCHRGLGDKNFEAAYWFKRSVEVARTNNLPAVLEAMGSDKDLKKIVDLAKIHDDLIDVALTLEEARAGYEKKMADREAAAVAEAAKGAKPDAGAKADPNAKGDAKGGAVAKGAVPPKPKATMRLEWAEADKSKVKDFDGHAFLTPWTAANVGWVLPGHWSGMQIDPGKTGKMPGLPGEHLFKYEKGKLLFDPDGPGPEKEDKFKAPVKPEIVTFKSRKYNDGTTVDVRMRMFERPGTFKVMGFELKNGGKDIPITVMYQGATAVTTKFNGYDITIMDDDSDGTFSSFGKDCFVVAKGKDMHVQPLSRYVYIGDDLFELKVDPNGQGIKFKPYDGATALVRFDYQATTMPAFMIAEGVGDLGSVYFNLMDAKDHPLWVPVGDYHFQSGYFAFGPEGDKRETIDVTAEKATNFSAKEGQVTTVQMGGAKEPGFTFHWKAEVSKDKGDEMVVIKGRDIKVFGCAGEEYNYFVTGPFKPIVRMKTGSKDGPTFYEKEMKGPAREDLGDKALDVVYWPKNLEVKKTAAGPVFIQLECVYPKLGKITSAWTQVP